MANFNKVFLLGRLTRDPEVRTFANGGKVAAMGFCVNNKKKNQQTGQYEDDPVFLDCEAFNVGQHGKTADMVEQYLRKGSQAFIEGRLKMDTWDDKQSGQKRSKLKIVVDNVQFLDQRQQQGASGGAPPQQQRQQPMPRGQSAAGAYTKQIGDESDHEGPGMAGSSAFGDDQIPF